MGKKIVEWESTTTTQVETETLKRIGNGSTGSSLLLLHFHFHEIYVSKLVLHSLCRSLICSLLDSQSFRERDSSWNLSRSFHGFCFRQDRSLEHCFLESLAFLLDDSEFLEIEMRSHREIVGNILPTEWLYAFPFVSKTLNIVGSPNYKTWKL